MCNPLYVQLRVVRQDATSTLSGKFFCVFLEFLYKGRHSLAGAQPEALAGAQPGILGCQTAMHSVSLRVVGLSSASPNLG